MAITRRTQLVLVLLLALFGAAGVWAHALLRASYLRLEAQDRRNCVQRVAELIAADMDYLWRTTRDYAQWDDTYLFIQGRNVTFLRENLAAEYFLNLGLDMVLLVDRQGRLRHQALLAGRAEGRTPGQELVNACLRRLPDYLDAGGVRGKTGLIPTQVGPFLVAAHPIVHSSGRGPVAGTMITGRYLNAEVLRRQAGLQAETVSVTRAPEYLLYSAPQTPAATDPTRVVTYVSADKEIVGYRLLPDLGGQNTLLLTVSGPRDIYHHGLAVTRQVMFTLALVALALIAVVLLERDRGLPDVASSSASQLQALALSRPLELERPEERLQAAGDLIPEIVFTVDASLRLTYVNAAGREALGYDAGEFRRLVRLPDLIAADSAALAQSDWQRLVAGERSLLGIYRLRRRDDTTFICEAHLVAMHNADGSFAGARGLARDLSDRPEMHQVQRLVSLGHLAAGVAHEFNNLLSATMGQAELALEDATSTAAADLANTVLRSGERGADICANLLHFARPRNPRREPVAIEEPLEQALRLAARELSLARIEVRRYYSTAGRGVWADLGQLEQVFLNLVMNACHAMSGGGVLRVTTALVSREFGIEEIVAAINDTGPGIAPEHMSKLFEPFFTTKRGETPHETKGTGLGLCVSQGIIRAHGGSLTARSRPGQGATFEVRLAACDLPQATGGDGTAPTPVGTVSLSGKRALIAEDEEGIRQALVGALRGRGMVVDEARTLDQGRQLLAEADFDLVVCDYLMPGGTGLQLLEAARQRTPQPRIVMITGLGDGDLCERFAAAGADCCLPKPFRLGALLQAAERLLASPH